MTTRSKDESPQAAAHDSTSCLVCAFKARVIAAAATGGLDAEVVRVVTKMHGKDEIMVQAEAIPSLLQSAGIQPPSFTTPPLLLAFKVSEHGVEYGLNAFVFHEDGTCHLLALRSGERNFKELDFGPREHVLQSYETGMLAFGLECREKAQVFVGRGGEA